MKSKNDKQGNIIMLLFSYPKLIYYHYSSNISYLKCFNTVGWATISLPICELIIYFLSNNDMIKHTNVFFLTNIYLINASRKYKPTVTQKRIIHPIPVAYMNTTCVLVNKNPSCCWSEPTVMLYPKVSVRLLVVERKRFLRITAVSNTLC